MTSDSALQQPSPILMEEILALAVTKASNLNELLDAESYQEIVQTIASSLARDMGYLWIPVQSRDH